jgi:predicted ATPase
LLRTLELVSTPQQTFFQDTKTSNLTGGLDTTAQILVTPQIIDTLALAGGLNTTVHFGPSQTDTDLLTDYTEICTSFVVITSLTLEQQVPACLHSPPPAL